MASGSFIANMQGVAISALTLATTSSWSDLHDQTHLVLKGSLRGVESEAICAWGELAQLVNHPHEAFQITDVGWCVYVHNGGEHS